MNIYSLYVIYYTRYFWWDWSQVQEQVQKFNLQHQGCQEWWIVQKHSFERFVGNWGNLTRGVFRNLSRGGLHFLSFQGGWLSTRKPPKSIDFTGPGELSPHCHTPPLNLTSIHHLEKIALTQKLIILDSHNIYELYYLKGSAKKWANF